MGELQQWRQGNVTKWLRMLLRFKLYTFIKQISEGFVSEEINIREVCKRYKSS